MSADLVERVRMALAEAGYPDARVQDAFEQWSGAPSVRVGRAPRRARWKAMLVCGVTGVDGAPLACFACWRWANDLKHGHQPRPDGWDCLARGLGIEDCGADRSET